MTEKRRDLKIEVNLDSDDIATGGGDAVRRVVAKALEGVGGLEEQEGKIRDINGNTVGKWEIVETEIN